jgi:hypothetical protein
MKRQSKDPRDVVPFPVSEKSLEELPENRWENDIQSSLSDHSDSQIKSL